MYEPIITEAANRGLPLELVNFISSARGSTYLEAITAASFDQRFTDLLLPLYHSIAAEISQRWLRTAQNGILPQEVVAVACFARILPFATYLKPKVERFLRGSRVIDKVVSSLPSAIPLDETYLQTFLIALFRLLSHDLDTFTDLVKPVFLCSLFSHESLPVRFLAIECFCQVMHFADALNQDLIRKYVGTGQIWALWEDTQVDLRLLKLHEERRWLKLRDSLTFEIQASQVPLTPSSQQFSPSDLSSDTADIAGVLVPKIGDGGDVATPRSTFVLTSTAIANLRAVAMTLHNSKPTLLSGPSGAGKTAIVHEIARQIDKLTNLVTLHLNDQTDAKSLLGIYTTSSSGNAFTWQPGVLTKAVQEGRWVLIEDIDRAPTEVIGLLRPLIENNELFLPSRKERLRPKDGFKIVGTVRCTNLTNPAGTGRHAFLSNPRLWSIVPIAEYSDVEVRELLQASFPKLSPFLESILSAHSRIIRTYTTDPAFQASQARLPSIRDLLKWCRRLSLRLESGQNAASLKVIPETFIIDMLKDGMDCYASHLNDSQLVYAITADIAEVINLSPTARDHAVKNSNPIVQHDKKVLQVGRSSLARMTSGGTRTSSTSKFALTRRVRQNMETVVSAVVAKEPLLLVGETGVGKTTTVQHIASSIGQDLTVVNLSNQSEASDLLGGLKPVTTRTLVVPLVDEFDNLFQDTFSTNKNEKFQQSITKAFARQRWSRLVGHWEEAIEMALKMLPKDVKSDQEQKQAAKRRKLEQSKYKLLRERWTTFANNVNQVKVQIQRGEQNQVFTFVESRLVQAVRSGTWLLLDEINLASSETLDNILSLFHDSEDDSPYLLLTEAGNIERIKAHPNFRIFAAMNPATDTGKKDLPPAIRAYFTEIFVHPGDDDLADLTEIVHVYLGSALENDKRAASDLAKAYLAMKALSAQHRLTDGAGDLPHFSLRSLTRCLQYVQQHASSHGLRQAMHEGMQMSFFTVLDMRSQQLAFPAIEQFLLASPAAKKAISLQRSKTTFDSKQYVVLQHHLIAKGTEQPDDQPQYIQTASVQRNLVNLARAASMKRFPILLQGPTSAGKTSMVEFLAKYSGNKFVRINNHEHTDLQEYLGSYASGVDGKLEYREGVLVEALRKGYWIVLDELNLAPSDVLEALNRLLDDNRELLIPESQEIVRPHPNFMLFATQNPAGLYGGRKRMSRAFRNRFLEIHIDDIPEDELEVILKERARIAPSFCRQIVEVYKKLSLQRQSSRLFEQRNSFATLRDLFRWASRPVDDREQLAYHGYMLLAERVRDLAEKAVVKSTIEETLKVKIDERQLYSLQQLPPSVISTSSITWTQAMRRLFVLVSNALKNNEPVLLVGETGCGKTQVCQTIAHAFGRHLNIYNAHSNTETGDLIGSQRPVRHKSELTEVLVRDLQSLGEPYTTMRSNESVGIDELISQFKNMDTSIFDKQTVDKVNSSITAYQSLFMWNDGSLVRAMKDGSHFLLDEISLADDSVLERMNSLLEPARTILLAEKGAEDNFVVAAPGFQFLATMNPGGDYGKRELSAALRNRLTEIWVPPLSDIDDVLPIVEMRLNGLDSGTADKMLKFAQFFRLDIQASNTATIPLRTLLNWADFVVRHAAMGIETALIHGAAMTYIDSLGANPAGMVSATIGDIQVDRKKCLAKLSELLNVEADTIYDDHPALEMDESCVHIGAFFIQRSEAAASEDELVLDAPTTLKNTMRIVRALQTTRPLLLEGNPGVGKTAIVSSLARICGRALTRINLSDQTDLMDLFGADAPAENEKLGQFTWRDGPLLKAMQAGGWVLLDEMNLASQSVLEGLNACLDHRKEVYIAELDKTFSCHPGFMLFATQNPHHQGGGRKGLPASFVNRFTVVYADPFQEEDLVQICKLKFPSLGEDRIRKVVETIDQCQSLALHRHEFADGGPWELNLRDLGRWLSLCEQYKTLEPEEHFDTVVAQRFRGQGARTQAIGVSQFFLGSGEESNLYHHLSPTELQVGTSLMPRDPVQQPVCQHLPLTTTHLRYARSAITGLTHGWPIILAGASGSGKTTLLRSLAALSGARLVELSMNTDIDTADLIGGYEQYDIQRELGRVTQQLKDLLLAAVAQCLQYGHGISLDVLVAILDHVESLKLNLPGLITHLTPMRGQIYGLQGLLDKLQALEDVVAMDSSRFVWNDGVLIDALSSGSWIVLDNANLCNPSVLDRLNSLLEPNGCLIVSEQHGVDGEARILRPHPDFRIILTMDPKFGELSRAMRNRSLEIFLDQGLSGYENASLPAYPTASSISRMRACHSTTLGSTPFVRQEIEPWLSQLTPQDLAINQSQIFASHTVEIQQLVHEEGSLYKSSDQLNEMRLSVLDRSDSTATGSRPQLDDQCQPYVLLVNEPRLRTSLTSDAIRSAVIRTQFQFLFTALVRCQHHIDSLPLRTDNIPIESLSVLQRSMPVVQSRLRRNEAQLVRGFEFVKTFAGFCFDLFRLPRTLLSSSTYSTVRDIIMLLLDMTSFFDQRIIPEEQLRAYVQIALNTRQELELVQPDLTERFSHDVLQWLESSYVLKAGYGLQKMWPTWKGRCSETAEEVRARIMMEQLINRFTVLSKILPHPRTELADVRLRLLEAHSAVVLRNDAMAQIQILNTAIDELAEQRLSDTDVQGHFALIFDSILARCRLQGVGTTGRNFQKLILFSTSSLTSDSPSNAAIGSPVETLERLSAVASIDGNSQVTPAVTIGDFSTEMLINKLQDMSEQPLGRLNYAQEEFFEIVQTFCNGPQTVTATAVSALRTCTTSLLKQVLTAHESVAEPTIEALFTGNTDLTTYLVDKCLSIGKKWPSYLVDIGKQYFMPALSHLERESYFDCGRALLLVSTACLRLLVTDKTFDPAIYPSLVRSRHEARTTELGARILAWKAFQRQTTGQNDSVIIRTLESELKDLGETPAAPALYRPAPSQMGVLQAHYTNILRSVVMSDIMTEFVAGTATRDPKCKHKGSQLISSIDVCVQRLSEVHRAYDDLVVPVRGLLQSLSLAVRILVHDMERPSTLAPHCSPMPWFNVRKYFEVDFESLSRMRLPQMWRLLESLKLCVLVERPVGISRAGLLTKIVLVIDQFYVRWKKQLNSDQADAEAQSKYYAYRGHEEGDEADERNVRALFPVYADDEEFKPEDETAIHHRSKVQNSAGGLAHMHRGLFENHDSKVVLRQYLQRFGIPDLDYRKHDDSLKPAYMPSVLLQIQDKLQTFDENTQKSSFNIYTDSSTVELYKLFGIVKLTQVRFKEIAARWPEHAIPADVLTYCAQLMDLRLNDPLTKVLTKTEKFLEVVAQWQAVASKEWSVTNIMDLITSLVIAWRRLELGSWSSLLDVEDEKQKDEADAWYFIAYEVVVYNSVLVAEQSEDIAKYCQDLTKTLEEFLKATTLGQFSHRLRLLHVFSHTLCALAEEEVRLVQIQQTLANIVKHYARYDEHIAKTLKDGRVALEKSITEQIKLASWKDTNITTLRESARRSHYKLFKIVKKYRTLLAQPVTNFKAVAMTDNGSEHAITLLMPDIQLPEVAKHLSSYAAAFEDWGSRPDRLRNPVGAVRTMQHAYRTTMSNSSASAELRDYVNELDDSMKELRKATPSLSTDENASLVRDLKQRKRRLLAETLKDVAQMGIRRNLGTDELAAQSSTAYVLARVPSLDPMERLNSTIACDVFHELLDALPLARQAAFEHSEELTDGEVRRGLGYLEGFLSLVIKQRNQIGLTQDAMRKFQNQVQLLGNLQLSHKTLDVSSETWVTNDRSTHYVASWASNMLDVFADIAEFQGQHADMEVMHVVAEMRAYSSGLRDIIARSSSNLPQGLKTDVMQANHENLVHTLTRLVEDARMWQTQNPQIDHLVGQLRQVIEAEPVPAKQANGYHDTDIIVLDKHTQNLLNSMFVALQRMIEPLRGTPTTTGDQGWLARITKTFSQALSTAQIDVLASTLGEILESLHRLDTAQFSLGISIVLVMTPIAQQFAMIYQNLYDRMLHTHIETCRLASFLSKSFTTLAREGFCSPSESAADQEQSGKVEQGTGLGEGDAAEDISKDVGDDEDLTDLAQTANEREGGKDELEKSKDAVDMGVDDLEGEMGSEDENASDSEDAASQASDEEGQDMEEETGSVDDLDPSAVDEKLWDDMQKETEQEQKEMKSQKAEGPKTDDQAAKQDSAEQEQPDDIEGDDNADENEDIEKEDVDANQKAEAENIDPHLQEEQALDLPEEMQLNGEEGKEDDMSDLDMDQMSDIEEASEADDKHSADLPDEDKVARDEAPEDDAIDGEDEDQTNGVTEGDELVEDQEAERGEEAEDDPRETRQDDTVFDVQDQENGTFGVANTNQNEVDEQMDEVAPEGQNDVESVEQKSKPRGSQQLNSQEEGTTGEGATEQGIGRNEEQTAKSNDALKKLADVLERYHQRREIFSASEDRQHTEIDQDIDMADADFEHLNKDEEEGQAQALGTANNEVAQKLDQGKAIEQSGTADEDDLPMPDDEMRDMQDAEQEALPDKFKRLQDEQENSTEQNTRGAIVPDISRERTQRERKLDEEMMQVDEDFEPPLVAETEQPVPPVMPSTMTSMADAQQLWSLSSTRTQALSLMLTEQLRLILQPTTATKLRGDFRTGKRLNIRRIIPYIASGYKRDKIWMRRSVPSKRNYQVMLAVDDSKSMAESGADILALETLCMLSRSLSMLEVGELSIIAFGSNYSGNSDHLANNASNHAVKIAHPFAQPFSPNQSGPTTFSNFTFNQTGTNVKALLTESIKIFNDARLKSSAREAADLWQLQIIISDGHIGSDADDSIRRLVRKAREEKIMSVFVIVDSGEESIVDLKEVTFEKNEAKNDNKDDDGMVVKTRRYLENFPFQYYVVVREVRDLPGVLSRVLKGWFEGVVEQG